VDTSSGQPQIPALADGVELVGLQRCHDGEKVFRRVAPGLAGRRFAAAIVPTIDAAIVPAIVPTIVPAIVPAIVPTIDGIEGVAANEFRHQLVPGGGEIEKVEAANTAPA
jgi:hypothetical protein